MILNFKFQIGDWDTIWYSNVVFNLKFAICNLKFVICALVTMSLRSLIDLRLFSAKMRLISSTYKKAEGGKLNETI